MKWTLARVAVAVGLLGAGCGGGDDPAGPGNGNGNGAASMKATVDGTPWQASSNGVQVTGSAGQPRRGTILISGVNINTGIGVTLSLSFIPGPGTYPLGVNIGTNAGGTAQVTDAPDSWSTPLDGAAGQVIITTRTSTRIAGTFEFSATPILGGAAIEITNGEFDITVDAGLPALPTGGGSVMTATLDGSPWNAATIAQVGGGLSFGGTTTEYSVNFVAKVPLAGGLFKLGNDWSIIVARTGTTDAWAVTTEDSVGTINFATVLPGRMQGFFSGTVPSLNAGAPITVADGFFSVVTD